MIEIKKSHRGLFTQKAKAHGEGVQQYAREVLASPNASAETKRQANFARNASHWKHGGKSRRRNTILER